MKKIFFALVAIAAIAACAKTEPVYDDVNTEIKISPVASLATKAPVYNAIDGTTYPVDEHFAVLGYWANEPAGSTFEALFENKETPEGDAEVPEVPEGALANIEGITTYLDVVDFAKEGNYWAGNGVNYYWPKNGSLRFACYSPATATGVLGHDITTDTWYAQGYTQSNLTAKTVDFMIAQTPKSYTAETATENVSVVFEHALSWITLKVKAKDAVAATAFTINEILINDVNTVADMQATYPDKVWSNWNTPMAYQVFSGAQDVTTTATDIESTEKGTVVIPQATTTVTVNYTQKALAGTPELPDQSITISLALDAELTPWEPGKHYVYTLIFGLDEILINPSVADWEDVNAGEDDITALEVTNETDLRTALANGKSVRLVADVTVSETLVINGDATLDLNGKTITNKVENTLTDVIQVPAGAILTINGNGNITAVSGNDGYAVIAEGKLIINGGTFQAGVDGASEPNAVIYARGNGEVYVNGGLFLNDNNTKFVLNKKDADRATTKIEVKGGKFYNFNPADNTAEGAGTNFLATGYKVEETVDGTDNVYTVVAE